MSDFIVLDLGLAHNFRKDAVIDEKLLINKNFFPRIGVCKYVCVRPAKKSVNSQFLMLGKLP